ncbi:MAG: tetratricopeptide repeat protein [Planctomycetota bacterium]
MKTRLLHTALLGIALLALTGCVVDDVPDSIRGIVPFLPPSKFVDRGGRKLTRSEAAFYQKLTDLSRATKVNPRDAVAYNAIGELLMKKGSYSLAKRCFLDSIDFDGTLSEPHHNVGRLYLLEERYHGALEELEKAQKLSPDDAGIRMRVGEAHAGLNKTGLALEDFNEAIALDKEYTPAYLAKARLLYAQRSYGEAADVCRTALQNIPPYTPPPAAVAKQTNIGLLDNILPNQKITEDDTPRPTYKEEAAYDLALCLKAQGLYSEAISALLGAESAADGRADVQILKAKCQDLMNDSSGALATLGLLRVANPDMAEVPKLMARLQDKMGQADLAAKTRLEAAELDQSDKDLQEEALRDAEAKRNKPRIIQLYERLTRIDPDNLRYRVEIARAYDEALIKREAAISWQEVLNLRERIVEQARRDGEVKSNPDPYFSTPPEHDIRRRTGMLYSDIPGFQGKAMLHFKRCLQLQPNDGEIHRRLGEMLLQSKNFSEAERHIRETLRVFPNDAKAHHNLATLHATQNNYDEAVEEYKKAIAADPNLDVAYVNLAKVLLGQNRRDEALQPLNDYTHLKPLDVEALRMLADLYRDLNNKTAALGVYERIVALESENGGNIDDLTKAVKVMWDMGNKNAAISDLEAQIEKHPSELRLLIPAGRFYSDNKQHTKAIYTWNRVLNISGNDDRMAKERAEALKHLAEEYDANGRNADAIKYNEMAGKGGDPEGYRRAADMYLKKGDTAKALDNFKLILVMKPSDIDARRNIAELLQTSAKSQDRDEALKLYQEIITLLPKDEAAHVNCGNLLADGNRFSEAQDEYDITLRLNAQNTSALIGRGVLFRKRSRYKDALEEYLKAIAIDPEFTRAYYNVAVLYDYYLKDPVKAADYYQKYIQHGGDPKKVTPETGASESAPLKSAGAVSPAGTTTNSDVFAPAERTVRRTVSDETSSAKTDPTELRPKR